MSDFPLVILPLTISCYVAFFAKLQENIEDRFVALQNWIEKVRAFQIEDHLSLPGVCILHYRRNQCAKFISSEEHFSSTFTSPPPPPRRRRRRERYYSESLIRSLLDRGADPVCSLPKLFILVCCRKLVLILSSECTPSVIFCKLI